ncbi:MAG: hypothetical protein H6Q58_262 [Firmicutes bacterium]|nr:hypothetical protein [Bacillota bacterium]
MKKTKDVYILLTHTGSLLSNMIKLYTKEPYSHVSISFDENLKEVYSFGRKKPRNPLIAGFIMEDIQKGTYSIFTETTYALYTFSVDDEQYGRLRECISLFENMKDKSSYNLLGLLGIILGYPINRTNSYFCSQFIACLFERSGIEIFDKPFGLVTPKDFRTSRSLKLLKSGKLTLFNSELPLESAVYMN